MIPRKAEQSAVDLFEPDIDIKGKLPEDDTDVMLLLSRQQQIFWNMSQFWGPYLDRGKTCFSFERGEIFDDATRARYEVEDKIPVETRKMGPTVNRLVGEMIQRRRSGQILSEGGRIDAASNSAEELDVINMVAKDAERRWSEQRLIRDVLQHGMFACYPVWVWYEKSCPYDYERYGKVHPVMLPWDSVMVAPFNFRNIDGSDITSVVMSDYMSDAQLMEAFPEQSDAIKEWNKRYRGKNREETNSYLNQYDDIANWDMTMTADQRQFIHYEITTGRSEANGPSGMHVVHKRIFQINKEQECAIDLFDPDDVIVKPGTWDDERWLNALKEMEQSNNTQYEIAMRPTRMLWFTAWTTSGIVLANEPHWFQKQGRMPGVPLIAAMLDGEPVGPAEAMLKSVLEYATMRTEFLDDIRKASGTLTIGREGAISNIDDLPGEMNRSDGFVSVKEDAGPLDDAVRVVERKPNSIMLDYSGVVERDLEESTAINREMQGQSADSRKSGIYQQTQIAQGLLAQSIYVQNFNDFWEAFQNLKLEMLPYAYDTPDVLAIQDDEPTKEPQKIRVNWPEYDVAGNEVAIINDLSQNDYRFKVAAVDDSPTARQWEFETFQLFLNSVPGPVMAQDPTGGLLAKLMMAMPNRFAKEAGKAMQEDIGQRQEAMSKEAERKAMTEAQEMMMKYGIEAEKAKKYGVNLSFTGEQLMQMPQLASFLQKIGFIEEQPMGQMAGQAVPPQGQVPTPQPAGV